ncbi:hypothetical protein J4N45_10975 [Vibrio sp. SCSIO 43140]|uniref:hypothetical protein n=1 Tax=Vibrio sp. SCSIO 43140 TaxID=2819100 RepID=UPI002075A268|nr:hypothetical protein [Vibrio sp. SCSIO 43140]USD59053.1 hypothetical protein J4N45_10975 [Vibrio sp. SCSIO 43140]
MTQLTCGSCGNGFTGEQTPSHDTGFGTCPECMKDEASRYQKLIEQAKVQLASSLSAENWIQFKNCSVAKQESIILNLIEKGVLKWSI